MNTRVAANIRRSFEPQSLGAVTIADSPARSFGTPLWQFPNFFKDPDGTLRCPQADHFGFYALARAVHAVLVGTTYLEAGDALRARSFCAARVVCYYTAALNVTQAHLALQGRVFIDNHRGPLKPRGERHPGQPMFAPLEGDQGSILAVLASDGRWVFEGRPRSHASRWKEFERVYPGGQNLPDQFAELFEYMLSYGPDSFSEICDSEDYEQALLREGAQAVVKARHEAMYQGYGYDDFALDLLVNGESGGAGLDRKPEALRAFVIGASDAVVADVFEALDTIGPDDWHRLQPPFSMAVMTPEFEIPSTELLGHERYQRLIVELLHRVFPVGGEGRDRRCWASVL